MTAHLDELVALAIDVIEATPAKDWRHHGFGLLSYYVTPAHRINMWAEELRQIQPREGAWHTHSSAIHSTILGGSVFNTEIRVDTRGEPISMWDLRDGKFRFREGALAEPGYRWERFAGNAYLTHRGRAHCTEPGPRGGVTSVLVMEQTERPPQVWTPAGVTPKLAFTDRASDEVIDRVRVASVKLLRAPAQVR